MLKTRTEAQTDTSLTMYSLFAWLWAMGIIWHYLRPNHTYPVGWADLIVAIAAILVLIRPKNVYYLLCAAASSIAVFLIAAPSPSNHWTMQFFVNATLCASFLMLAVQRRTWHIDGQEWLRAFRPAVCLLVVLLYLFASLHKLNSGYFSEHSAALSLYRNIVHGEQMRAFAQVFPAYDAFLALLPPVTIVIELGVPVLLFFRPTRLLGLLIGMAFHAFVSLNEYPPGTDFPTLLGAAYVLFFPHAGFDILNASIISRLRESRYYEPFKSLIIPAIMLAVIFVPPLYDLPKRSATDWFGFANLKSAHWSIYVAAYLALLIFLIVKLRSVAGDRSLSLIRGQRLPLMPILVLTIFVGLSPYLGLRSAGAFTMFSNLETEGSASNHFFMPFELQVFDYQKQVCVIETTAEDIPKTAFTGRLLTWFQFRRLARRNPEASITYTFKGERFELKRIADKLELSAEPDWFERHYLTFLHNDIGKKTTYCD